ncbi:MAG: FAD-dependent oxidoreductase [Candidatus Micrarchaeota archaeon]
MTKTANPEWDLVIVGYGLTGLAAAMYAGRLELKTVLVGEIPGGLITWTDLVENYPGFKRLTGQELTAKLREHAQEYNVPMDLGKIDSIAKLPNGFFELKSESKTYVSKTVLVATGTKVRELDVSGSKEFKNKGIQFCALCDAPLYKGKDVALIGGSDSAAKEAIVLSRYAKKVYVVYRGKQLRAEPPNMERLKKISNIEYVLETNVAAFKGTKFLEKIELDKAHNGKKELSVSAAFVSIGHLPLSELAKPLGVKTNSAGEIIVNRNSETNIPGIFAAGDVVDTRFKQAIVGVGEAVSAVYSALQFITGKN